MLFIRAGTIVFAYRAHTPIPISLIERVYTSLDSKKISRKAGAGVAEINIFACDEAAIDEHVPRTGALFAMLTIVRQDLMEPHGVGRHNPCHEEENARGYLALRIHLLGRD